MAFASQEVGAEDSAIVFEVRQAFILRQTKELTTKDTKLHEGILDSGRGIHGSFAAKICGSG